MDFTLAKNFLETLPLSPADMDSLYEKRKNESESNEFENAALKLCVHTFKQECDKRNIDFEAFVTHLISARIFMMAQSYEGYQYFYEKCRYYFDDLLEMYYRCITVNGEDVYITADLFEDIKTHMRTEAELSVKEIAVKLCTSQEIVLSVFEYERKKEAAKKAREEAIKEEYEKALKASENPEIVDKVINSYSSDEYKRIQLKQEFVNLTDKAKVTVLLVLKYDGKERSKKQIAEIIGVSRETVIDVTMKNFGRTRCIRRKPLSEYLNDEPQKISFESDYTEGAHPEILDAFVRTNLEQLSGYGKDKYCESAKKKIRKACGIEDADIYFISGGTQTNQLVIDTMLKPFEGVVSTVSGHIEGHEAGAVEFTGHKVLTVPHHFGKMDAVDLKNLLLTFYGDDNHDHMVFPGMVYISHPSEYGTLYSLSELTAISDVCREYNIPLFLDGARLGYGLMSHGTDVSIRDIARLCDVFYIGGTKVGALCGEAVVFTKNNTPAHFFTSVKQHGALLAKGRLLGVQFDTLFTNDLYFKIAANAIDKADKMRKAFKEKGYEFFMETVTNQIFIILENDKMQELKKYVSFGFWEKYDENHTVVRFASSWATTDEAVDKLISLL